VRVLPEYPGGRTIDTVRLFASIEPIAQSWRQLAAAVHAAPFLWPGWTAAWLDAFGGDGLRICTAWRGGDLVGVLPTLTGPRVCASPTNDQTPVFGPLAIDGAAAAALAPAVVGERPYRVDLGYMDPADASTAGFAAALHDRGYRRLRQQTLRAPFTELSDDWEAFCARFSRNRRKALRRTERRLREQGDLRVDLCDGTSDLEDLLAEGFGVEGSGWKGAQGTAINARAAHRHFYTEIARWAADRKWLQLAFLRLDGRAIAFEFLLRHDGVIHDLKGGYDEDYRTWGPGILLMNEIVRAAVADGTHRIEWLGTDDPYKLEWSDGVRERVTATWLGPTVRGRAEYHSRTLRRAAVARARDALRERLSADAIARLKAARGGFRRPS
jgi:CelD/BcsL family acetyltransferase involved in cellulose biosynthesis